MLFRSRALRRRRFWRGAAIGASLAAAAAVAMVLWPEPTLPGTAPNATSLPPNVPRQIALADGSIVELNRDSEVLPQFTRTERRVILLKGEAHFSVTKDPTRPFIVRAGHVDVRAVGTAFNVLVQSDAVQVSVTEGKVRVTPDQAATEASDTYAAYRVVCQGVGGGSVVAADSVAKVVINLMASWDPPPEPFAPITAAPPAPPAKGAEIGRAHV